MYALALGYEDLNDHEELHRDNLLALLVGKRDLTGAGRVRLRDRGSPLAASSTLNRLELGGAERGGVVAANRPRDEGRLQPDHANVRLCRRLQL